MKKFLIALVVAAGVIGLGCVQAAGARGEPEEVMLKLTYVGPQDKVFPSIGISVEPFDLNKFEGRGTQGIDYSNDYIFLLELRVSADEMKRVLDATAGVATTSSSDAPRLSLMVYNTSNGSVAEALLDAGQARALADRIAAALDQKNIEGLEIVDVLRRGFE